MTAQIALGKLDQQRRRRFVDRLECRGRERAPQLAGLPETQAVQPLVAPALAPVEMAIGMGDEGGAACSLGVDPQGRLLGHRAGRQEQRRRLAEHFGDFRLELRDNSALSVLVLFVSRYPSRRASLRRSSHRGPRRSGCTPAEGPAPRRSAPRSLLECLSGRSSSRSRSSSKRIEGPPDPAGRLPQWRSTARPEAAKRHQREDPRIVAGLAQDDLKRMRDALFFEGVERNRRLSRFWLLLPLSAVIAAAGVVSDSTATVIGAMIVAPLMTPILGIVLAVVLTDAKNLRRSILLVVVGAAVVVGLAWVMGLFVPYPVVAATNTQVAARVTPRLVDLVAALATGAVGSVALARSDISDTLPGVAIAISLVPPLAVVGLTLESGAPHEALGALLLFTTNVAAILASGIVVMALYRIQRISDQAQAPAFHRRGAVAVVAIFLIVVIVPLTINSDRIDRTTVRQADVQAVADHWANAAGWSVVGVAANGDRVLIDATGPSPAPDLAVLRKDLVAVGLSGVDVEISLAPSRYKRI